MTPTARTRRRSAPPREVTAERLLDSSASLSLDPLVEVDWDAPEQPGRWFLPPERSSLYGTDLWEELTVDQRIELTRHEVCSIASVGIWFEVVLMRMLLRHVGGLDPTSRHAQYALTEIGDECRHSVMFGRMIDRLGCPAYGPGRQVRRAGAIFSQLAPDTVMFAAGMYVEEILDSLQREAMADERVQPIVRQVSRVHVVEEARHIRYAADELARTATGRSGLRARRDRLVTAAASAVATIRLVHPRAYAAVGIDPLHGAAAARTNPAWQQTVQQAAAGVMRRFDEYGLLDAPSRRVFRAAGILAT